ncbi:pyrophosphate-energized vacuolar membrane proton pump 1-like [Apium graveolens]|uniref:pyrophosphate-energized vacuolar membrane proton pump 1-like n=1 Tax=Apium graveolens TaxID=4045 RepID=UPI003D7A0600
MYIRNVFFGFYVRFFWVVFGSFRSDYILGQDDFGTIYKGYIDENLRVGLKYLPVAFKILIRKRSRVIVSGLRVFKFILLVVSLIIMYCDVIDFWQLFLCVCVGLWAGLIIGFVTEYYTSNAYSPVQDVADSCKTGAATNVIFGLALGYKSVIIPIFAIAVSIFVSFSFAAMYGIIVASLGMLSKIATGLAIDAYGPISDNAGGITEMACMSHRIPERTDALDAAGNTTASIGKEMISPGALVMLTPLIVGILFGVETLSGVLAGSLVSGVHITFHLAS